MTPLRFKELTVGFTTDSNHLTDAESEEGWHFCNEWDEMLIHNTHPEFNACVCAGLKCTVCRGPMPHGTEPEKDGTYWCPTCDQAGATPSCSHFGENSEPCPVLLGICEHFIYQCDNNGEVAISHCKHPDNSNDYEGNCTTEYCPIYAGQRRKS